jgi:hypothetical protein
VGVVAFESGEKRLQIRPPVHTNEGLSGSRPR